MNANARIRAWMLRSCSGSDDLCCQAARCGDGIGWRCGDVRRSGNCSGHGILSFASIVLCPRLAIDLSACQVWTTVGQRWAFRRWRHGGRSGITTRLSRASRRPDPVVCLPMRVALRGPSLSVAAIPRPANSKQGSDLDFCRVSCEDPRSGPAEHGVDARMVGRQPCLNKNASAGYPHTCEMHRELS